MTKPMLRALGFFALAAATPASAAVIIDQLPAVPGTWAAVESQDFEADYDAYDSATIDDFTIGAATALSSIDAILYHWNGGHAADVGSFTVNIYSSVAHATASLTGDVYSHTFLAGATTLTSRGGSYSQVHVPLSTVLGPGTYWIALVSNYPIEGGGQIGVAVGGTGNGYFVNPQGGFGFTAVSLTSLTGGGGAAAYRVEGDAAPTPAPEPASWVMMVSGFGTVGGAMRRRKSAVSFG